MPEKWHCFFVKPSHIHKYSMKYDFRTYILDKLNEADEKKKKEQNITINKGGNKKVVISSNTTEKELVNFFKKYIDDIDIKEEGDKKVYVFNGEQGEYSFEINSGLPFDKLYKKALESSRGDNDQKLLDEDGFKLLGKTIAYRSALTAWSIINNSGDDFKQAALDVFKDNSEYSIKQLENLDSLLDYSAADLTIKQKIKRNDKNDANYEKNLKTYKEYEEQLKSKENFNTIQTIKKNYEKEFKDTREVLEQAFNDGMAEQKKDMQAKDYKWKDPVTGLPPKGKLAKSNQAADAIFKAIQSGVEKADEFAKRQQGMDKVILTLAVMGVKGMMFGGKMLKKLLTGFLKKTNLKDIMRYTAKFNDIKDKIIVFKKEYDEWKKYNDAQQQKKEKTDDEKKEEENRKKTISMKLSELMNTHVIPYYYCKMAIIVACFENIEGKYIIKQENNKWSTYNSGSGRLTIIEDNAILMERILEVVNDQLVKKGVFETLKDESSTDAFKGIPKDLKYKKEYADNLLKWKDKIKSVSAVSKFNKDNLKNILNVYNEKVIANSFASYEEFAKYVPEAQGLVKLHDIPVAKEIVIKFDGDEDAGVPGVITGAKKEETKEEQTPEEDKEYQKILNSVEDIKNATNAEEVTKNYGDTKEKVDKAVDQIQNNIKDQEIKDYLDKHFLNIQKADTLTKMMYLNTAKSKGLFDSCVSFNYAMNMLLEATNSSGNSSEVFKDIVNLLNGESNDNTIGDFKKKDEELKTSMEKAKEQMKDDVKKALPDDPLAVYSYLNKKEEPKKLEVNVDTLIQQLERPDTDYEKLQKEYASYDKMIKDYIGKDKDKLEKYTRGSSIIKEFGDDIIPKLWFAKRYSDWVTKPKESYDPFIDYSLLFLLEDDETNNKDNKAEVSNKIKEAHNQLDDIISADSLEPYKKWKAGIIELFKQFGDKIENKDELKDPVQMLSAMIDYMESNASEEKKGKNPQLAEEG